MSESDSLLGGSNVVVIDDDHFTRDEGFPKDLAPRVAKFSDIPALAKGYVDLQAKLSESISLPKEDATPEERAEQMGKIYDKLGRKKPEDYKITKPENLPAGVEWSDDLEAKVRVLANKAGWTNEQAQQAVDFWTEFVSGMAKKTTDARKIAAEQATQQLREKWGDVKYEVNMAAAKEAFQKIVPEPLQELFIVNGLDNDARFIEWMLDVFKKELGEGTSIVGDTPGVAGIQKILTYDKMNPR